MAPSTTLIILMSLYLVSFSCLQSSFAANIISAPPALLPTPVSSSSSSPLSSPSPALSPDITPLFPSPTKGELSPTESSLPTIPSSPSPPNPDDVTSFGPNAMAISPSGSFPVSSSVSLNSGMVVLLSLGAFWSFQRFI